MPGLNDFVTESNSYRVVTTQAANYTVLLSDEFIRTNGAITVTLPALSSLQGTTYHMKAYRFQNIHASSSATIACATGNTIGSVATSVSLRPNETMVFRGNEASTSWKLTQPTPLPVTIRQPALVDQDVVSGVGLSALLFGGFGAPTNLRIRDIWFTGGLSCEAGVYTASLVGGSTICSITFLSTNSGQILPGTLEVTAVAKGVDIVTMQTVGNSKAKWFLDSQEVAITDI